MTFGLRGILAIVIPSAVGIIVLAHPLIDLVLFHGAETASEAQATGATLAMFGLGLPGFCTYLYMVRVLQSMQDTQTAFRLYLVENGINVVLAIALVGPLGVRGLALSVSVAYTAAAVLAMVVIHRRVGGLGPGDLGRPLQRVVVGLRGHGRGHRPGRQRERRPRPTPVSWPGSCFATVVGVAVYLGAVVLLGARDERAEGSDPEPGDDDDPAGSSPAAAPVPPESPTDEDLVDEAGPDEPLASGTSTTGFRGKLHDRIAGTPQPHLQAVTEGSDGDEEELDGPNPGGDR